MNINEIKLITSKYKSLVLGINLDHQFKIREAIIIDISNSNLVSITNNDPYSHQKIFSSI